MKRVNIPASLSNLEVMNRVQSKENHLPTHHQVQVSDSEKTKADQKLQKPNELEEDDKVLVDSKEKEQQGKGKQKKRDPRKSDDKKGKNRGPSSGKFVDFSV